MSTARRLAVRLAAAAAALLLLAVVAGALLLLVTPGAGDAPQRVAARLAAHHADGDNGAVPDKVGRAVVATEDSRFAHHAGLDLIGVARAVVGLGRGGDQGGATLEQQLAKELWTPADRGLRDKAEDAALAVKLDADFSKRRLLALYLDTAYYGDGAYGVVDAARHYFGVSPGDLTWGQASLLAGLVQAPSAYDPDGHLHLALQRRAHVLDRLVAVGALSRAEADAAAAAPLHPAVPFSG